MACYHLDIPMDDIDIPVSDIEAVGKLENKSKWVHPSGINPNEGYDILVGEATACRCFIVEPRQLGHQRTSHTLQLGVTHP